MFLKKNSEKISEQEERKKGTLKLDSYSISMLA